MHMRLIRRGVPVVASVAVVLSGAALASAATGQPSRAGDGPSRGIRHALLISVDGLHQQDLAWYVKAYPDSVLAALDHRGLEYSNADTPFPSDSFPGMVGQVTGGDPRVGVPAIFGMNFQTVSTAEKLPASDGLTGGYRPGGAVPGPLLVRALNYINTEVGAMVARIRAQGLAGSTAVIISAKHGQSPTDPGDLARVPDGPIISAINAAWTAAHPGAGSLVVFSVDDDVMLLWLSDRSQAAAGFVKNYLLAHSAAGNNIGGSPVTVPASGLKTVYAGAAAACETAALSGLRSRPPRSPRPSWPCSA